VGTFYFWVLDFEFAYLGLQLWRQWTLLILLDGAEIIYLYLELLRQWLFLIIHPHPCLLPMGRRSKIFPLLGERVRVRGRQRTLFYLAAWFWVCLFGSTTLASVDAFDFAGWCWDYLSLSRTFATVIVFNNSPSSLPSPDGEKEQNIPSPLGRGLVTRNIYYYLLNVVIAKQDFAVSADIVNDE